MRNACADRPDTTIFDAAARHGTALDTPAQPRAADPALTGRWHSADGTVRLELEPDGTYRGTVAGRSRAARGTYRVDGPSVLLHDDSGLSTPVTRLGDTLAMAGYDLHRA